MRIITEAGSAPVIFSLGAILATVLFSQRNRLAACYVLVSLTGSVIVNQLCKHIFARARPDLWVSGLPESSFSFPSGHAMNSMAMCAALVIVVWLSRWRTAALTLGSVFVLLVGFSRVYWGVHYPSDIVAGWACAIAWVCSVKYVFDWRFAAHASAYSR